MIRSTRVANSQRGHAQILERLHPRLKNRRDGFVALEVDAPDGARAIIDIEITGEFCVLRFQFHIRAIGKVLRHVSARSEKALFFARPQAEADRAAHPEMTRLEDTGGIELDGRSGSNS